MKEIAVKSEGVLPKRAQQIRPKRFTCVYVDNDSVFLKLRDHFQGRTGLESALFPFHPQLLQVKSQCQKKEFYADIGLASGQKAAESKVIFEQSKCALHLDGAAKAQMNAALCHDICGCLLPLFPEGFLEHNLLGLVQILGPAALYPAGTFAAIFTPVPGGGHKLSVLHLRCLPSQAQLSALCAGEAVCFGVIFHIFNSPHLFAKLARFLLVAVGGLYEAHLATAFQIQIIFQTLIARIRYNFLIAGLVPPGQRFQHGAQRFYIRTV